MGWGRVKGHDALVEGFRRVLARGRLAHAYLFVGPPGVGKRLFATELARALLCEKPAGPLAACDACASCAQIDAESHPDFYPAARPEESLEFPIELMRKLCASFSLKSARGRGKVVLIDDADDLNDESANCFLKTLEEPPARSVLVLIGSSPERQLPTVVSRCQVVRFAPLPGAVVEGLLGENGVEDAAMRRRLVRLGGGSPGVALGLADEALWEFRSRLMAGLTATPIDAAALAKAWTAFVESSGKEAAVQRRQSQRALRLALDVLSDALAAAQGAASRRTTADDAALVSALAARGEEALLAAMERCLLADQQIEWRVQLVLVVEALLDALAQRLAA